MKLVENWQDIAHKAWSFKFNIAAIIFGGAEVAAAIFQPESVPRGVLAGIAAMITVLSNVARLLAQKELTK